MLETGCLLRHNAMVSVTADHRGLIASSGHQPASPKIDTSPDTLAPSLNHTVLSCLLTSAMGHLSFYHYRGTNDNTRPGRATGFASPCLFLLLALLIILTARSHAGEPWVTHTIEIDDEGMATVSAQLQLPVPPATTYAVLTDYPHWPDLFPRHPFVKSIQNIDGRTRVAMRIPITYLPLHLELVTDTVETVPVRLNTTLVEGDFERYDWIWDLSQSPSDTRTTAHLFMTIHPAIRVPDWVLHWLLESELTAHFQLLREQVMVRHRTSSSIATPAALTD